VEEGGSSKGKEFHKGVVRPPTGENFRLCGTRGVPPKKGAERKTRLGRGKEVPGMAKEEGINGGARKSPAKAPVCSGKKEKKKKGDGEKQSLKRGREKNLRRGGVFHPERGNQLIPRREESSM